MESGPEPIIATYTINFNIKAVHEKICAFFEKQKEQVLELEEEKKKLRWIIENSCDAEEEKLAKEGMKKLDEQIYNIVHETIYQEYLFRVKDLIAIYPKILPKKIKVRFGQKDEVEDPHLDKRLFVITKYLSIAKKYYPINVSRIEEVNNKCEQCGCELENFDFGLGCRNCGNYVEFVEKNTKNTEQNEVKNSTEEKRKNFEHIIDCFQGQQSTPPSIEEIENIRNIIIAHKKDPKVCTKELLYNLIKEQGNKQKRGYHINICYNDIHYVHWKLTDVPCPDISQYRTSILHRHDLFEAEFGNLKGDERRNSLHTYTKLKVFLEQEGFECKKEDFFTLDTKQAIRYCNHKIKECCKRLQEKYPHMNWKVNLKG